MWTSSSRQPVGQVGSVAMACLEVTVQRVTVGSSRKPGPRWAPLVSMLASMLAMLLGPSSMYRSGPFFWMGEKRVTSSKKWVMSPILWKGSSMWGAGLLGFPTF